MRLVITGGGTGGHIYPAIAVAKRMKSAIPDAEVLYLGSVFGPEKRLVGQEKIPFQGLTVKEFEHKSPLKNLWSLALFFRSLFEAFMILRRYRPDLVLGTGGVVSGAVILAAWILGIETMIHEQNAVPARTTRILSNYASKILVSYKESIPYFKNQNRLFYTGNPVREAFLDVTREEARKHLQLEENAFLILFHGGANGAPVINDMAISLMERLDNYPDVHIYLLTGRTHYRAVKKRAEKYLTNPRVHIYDYTHHIVRIMRSADLAVCRAGAVALAEMTAIALPGILVPNPKSANKHQMYNAEVFKKAGACLVLPESLDATERFFDYFDQLYSNQDNLLTMKGSFAQLQRENALNTIISIIYTYHLR